MDLEKITAKIRPRRGWEAIDLGVSLVQKHALVLYKIWFTITLPLFILLSVAFHSNPIAAVFVFWWLKPIVERPLLHFLSRELFGEGLSAKQCIKAFFSVAKIQWFMSLTLRRFSFTRSFDLPLIQLEGLKGNARSKRLRVIHSGDSGSAVWLTIIFVVVEMIIYFSIISLIYLMTPDIYLENFKIWEWISMESESIIVAHTLNFITYIAYSLMAPFYVACGFSLYINQRTQLEAWDIELAFKRLASRLSERSSNSNVRLASWIAVGFLVVATSFLPFQNVHAGESEIPTEKVEKKDPDWKEKLDFDNLSHEDSKKIIEEIKSGDDFHRMEKVESNEYRSTPDLDDIDAEPFDFSPGWFTFAKIMAVIIEFALWIFIAVLILFLILKYKHLIVRSYGNKKVPKKRPTKLFGLDLTSESLPDKPWLVAKQLIDDNQYREALSLLYRASLIWYIDHSDAVIKEGYTELECLKHITNSVSQQSSLYMKNLTNNWRGLAYAHQIPEVNQLNELCDRWPNIMVVSDSNNKDLVNNGQGENEK